MKGQERDKHLIIKSRVIDHQLLCRGNNIPSLNQHPYNIRCYESTCGSENPRCCKDAESATSREMLCRRIVKFPDIVEKKKEDVTNQ